MTTEMAVEGITWNTLASAPPATQKALVDAKCSPRLEQTQLPWRASLILAMMRRLDNVERIEVCNNDSYFDRMVVML